MARASRSGEFLTVRREVRRRGGPGSAERIVGAAGHPRRRPDRARRARCRTRPSTAARRRGGLERRRRRSATTADVARGPVRWPRRSPRPGAGRPTRRRSSRASRVRADADRATLAAPDRPEPADHRTRGADRRRPRDRPVPARPPAGRPAALRRVAGVRRRPRPDAPRAAPRSAARASAASHEPVPAGPRRLLDLPGPTRARRRPPEILLHAPRAGPHPAGPLAVRVGLARGRRAGRRRRAARAARGDRLRGRRPSRRSTTWTS